MNANIIITCDHKECEYCHEGECGKDCIWIDDKECKYMSEKGKRNK